MLTYILFISWFLRLCLGGALTEGSLNTNRFIPKTISEYPSPIHVRTKYTTDEEDYTQSESISFALLFNQPISQATTVLAGFAYDNIYYVFDIEVNRRSSRVRRKHRACFFAGWQAKDHLLARWPTRCCSHGGRNESHADRRWSMASIECRTSRSQGTSIWLRTTTVDDHLLVTISTG